MDSIRKNSDFSEYSGFTCWFLKESPSLKKISSCETTDASNLNSDEHKLLVLFNYNKQKNVFEEAQYSADASK